MSDQGKTVVAEITGLRQTIGRLEQEVAELRATAGIWNGMLDSSLDSIFVIRRDGVVENLNPIAASRLGLGVQEIIGKNIFDLLPSEIGRERKERIAAAFGGEGFSRWEDRRGEFYFLNTAYATKDGRRAVIVSSDVTDRRLAEESSQNKRARLRTLIGTIPDLIWLRNTAGAYVNCNPKFERFLGAKEADIIGRTDHDFLPKNLADSFQENARRALQAGMPVVTREWVTYADDGHRELLEVTDAPFTDSNGRLMGVMGIARDVTEQVRAEEALRAERNLARSYLETVEAIIVALDDQGRVSMINRKGCEILGYARTELVGQLWFDLCLPQPDGMKEVYVYYRRMLAGEIDHPEYHENPVRTRAGELRHIAWHNSLLRDAAGKICGTLSAGTDITEQRKVAGELRESEARFRQLVESIHEVFWMRDVEQRRFVYVSPGFEIIWGRPCTDLYAAESLWTESIKAEDRERVMGAMAARQAAGDYDETYRIVRPDGTVRWIRERAFPVKELAGGVGRIVGVAEDITERKKLEEQFLHAQRMEAIGTLASGVAHDLNNILAPMLMVAGLLKESVSAAEDRELLSMIDLSVQRGAGIVRQLLNFSRSIPGERAIVQPGHLIRDMLQLMRETFPRNIGIIESVPAGLWPIEADATQLHQVIMNLCLNARDAMPTGGTLTLAAENTIVDRDAPVDLMIKAGSYLLLSVQDTGHGIPPGILGRIFDPFFTTKEVGKGTGLGLSTVAGIIKGHGGVVKVYSEPGRGTAFRCYVPASQQHVIEGDQGISAAPMLRGQNELILVVDDEAPFREALVLFLARHGYRTLTAESGEAAIKVFMQHQGALRLVVTDMMMPGMDGLTLIRSLRVVEPGIRVIATSGLAQAQSRNELAALGVTDLLEKPFRPVMLLRAIRDMLAK